MRYEITFRNGKTVSVTRTTLDGIFSGIERNSNAQLQTVWEQNEGSKETELCIVVNVLEITCITPHHQ